MPVLQSSTAPRSQKLAKPKWQGGYSISDEDKEAFKEALAEKFESILKCVYSKGSEPEIESATEAAKSCDDASAVARFLSEVYQLCQRDELKANDEIQDFMDDRLLAGSFSTCAEVFREIVPDRLLPSCILSLLVVTRRAREKLGRARTDFVTRAKEALVHKRGLAEAERLITTYA